MPVNHSLNILYLEQYSTDLAKRLCDHWFGTKSRILGPDIKCFTPVKQLNLFLVKGLLSKWRSETERLKSPWFDYSDPEVKEALTQFMNILSRNISVKRESFEPLLKNSIQASIRWVVEPFEFYSEEIDALGTGQIEVSKLREAGKFFVFNKELIDRVWAGLDQMKQTEIYAGELKRMVKQELFDRSFTLTTIDDLAKEYSALLTLDISELTSQPKAKTKIAEQPVQETASFFDEAIAEVQEESREPAPEAIVEPVEASPMVESEQEVVDAPAMVSAEEIEKQVIETTTAEPVISEIQTAPVEPVLEKTHSESDTEYKKRMEQHRELLRKLNPFTSRKQDDKSDVKVTVVSGHPNKNIGYTVFPEPGGEMPAFMQKEGFKKAEANLDKKDEAPNATLPATPIEASSQVVKAEDFNQTPKEDNVDSLYDLGEVDEKPAGLSDVLTIAPENSWSSVPQVAVLERVEVLVEAPLEEPAKRSSILASISLNDSIMFKDKLFARDQVKFEQALIMLEKAGSRFEAMEKILNDLAPDNNWDLESHEGERFVRVIENFYAKK